MAHRKDNIAKACEFLKKELLDGDYRITDSEGHPLPLGEITALWNDTKIAKKFGVGQTTINYLRNDLGIPSYHQRKRIVDAMFNGENCQTVQKSPVETKDPWNTLPSWVKMFQWVMDKDGQLWKIVGKCNEILQVSAPHKALAHSGHWQEFKPVRFREYTYEEAKGLLGKTIEYDTLISPARKETVLIHRVTQYLSEEQVYIYSFPFSEWKTMKATIDGIPIGVPEIDEAAMKGGAE